MKRYSFYFWVSLALLLASLGNHFLFGWSVFGLHTSRLVWFFGINAIVAMYLLIAKSKEHVEAE